MLGTVTSMGVALAKRAVYGSFEEGSLYKRAFEGGEGNTHQLPKWAPLVFLANFVVFFPVLLYVSLPRNIEKKNCTRTLN